MIKHKQTILHDPPRSYGDCHRAALASLLELNPKDVPHFMQGLTANEGEIFYKLQEDFLNSIGLTSITFPCQGELEVVLKACGVWNPNKLFLLGGIAREEIGHTVIASPNGIVHDPHPSNLGITSPMKDGYYWVTYVVGLGLPMDYK